MPRVAAAKFFAHLGIGPFPEAAQVARHLDGAAVRSQERQQHRLAAGADAFLQKPLDPLRLVSTVKDLLGTSAFLQRATAR